MHGNFSVNLKTISIGKKQYSNYVSNEQGACLTIDILQVCITNIVIRLVTQRPDAVASRAN